MFCNFKERLEALGCKLFCLSLFGYSLETFFKSINTDSASLSYFTNICRLQNYAMCQNIFWCEMFCCDSNEVYRISFRNSFKINLFWFSVFFWDFLELGEIEPNYLWYVVNHKLAQQQSVIVNSRCITTEIPDTFLLLYSLTMWVLSAIHLWQFTSHFWEWIENER